MTFCLGITVEDGLVGIADTRVLSGTESLMAKKVATYQGPGFSFFILNSGLRSLRDKVLDAGRNPSGLWTYLANRVPLKA